MVKLLFDSFLAGSLLSGAPRIEGNLCEGLLWSTFLSCSPWLSWEHEGGDEVFLRWGSSLFTMGSWVCLLGIGSLVGWLLFFHPEYMWRRWSNSFGSTSLIWAEKSWLCLSRALGRVVLLCLWQILPHDSGCFLAKPGLLNPQDTSICIIFFVFCVCRGLW